MAKASASNPYGTDKAVDKNGVAENNFTAKSSSSKSSSSSSSSSAKSSSSSSSKTGTYDPSKPQGAQMSGISTQAAARLLWAFPALPAHRGRAGQRAGR